MLNLALAKCVLEVKEVHVIPYFSSCAPTNTAVDITLAVLPMISTVILSFLKLRKKDSNLQISTQRALYTGDRPLNIFCLRRQRVFQFPIPLKKWRGIPELNRPESLD